jgi:hypothetical protein
MLRLIVFMTRFLDLFFTSPDSYNIWIKCYLVIGSTALLVIILWQKLWGSLSFATLFCQHDYSSEQESRSIGYATILSTVVLAGTYYLATQINYRPTLGGILWSFSAFLGACAELPQLHSVYRMDNLDLSTVAYYASICASGVTYLGISLYLCAFLVFLICFIELHWWWVVQKLSYRTLGWLDFCILCGFAVGSDCWVSDCWFFSEEQCWAMY